EQLLQQLRGQVRPVAQVVDHMYLRRGIRRQTVGGARRMVAVVSTHHYVVLANVLERIWQVFAELIRDPDVVLLEQPRSPEGRVRPPRSSQLVEHEGDPRQTRFDEAPAQPGEQLR